VNAHLEAIALRLCALALAAGLAGCGTSAPARFYTLVAGEVPATASPLAGRRIIVGPIELPPYLDRPQMAIRGPQGEISFQEFDRWAEPLEASFLASLVNDLVAATGTEQVVAVPLPQRLPFDYRLFGRVSRFDVDEQGQAVLIAQWYVSDSEGKVLLTPRQGTYRRTVTTPPEPAAMAAALGATISDFAVDVARSLAAADPVSAGTQSPSR